MKDKPLACELPELAADTTRQRIQLYPGPGDYVHPVAGPFTLTADTLAEYADDINARGDRIPLDYDHSPEKGLGTRAAGWFVADTARVEGDGSVTAEVDWTPPAAEAIRNREYRFISPTFAKAHRDMHGKLIEEPKQVGAALTNRPFFNVMQPLAADEIPVEDELVVEDVFGTFAADCLSTISAAAAREIIAAAVAKKPNGRGFADPGYRKDGKPRYPLTSADEVMAAWKAIGRKQVAAAYESAQLSRIKARIKRAATKIGVTIGADETTKEKTMELTEALAADLGVAVDADDETILAAMERVAKEKKDLEAKQSVAPVITAAEVAELKAANARNAEKAKTHCLDAAVEKGVIEASERDFYAAAYDRDPDGTEAFLAEKKPVVQMAPAGHGREPVKVGDLKVDTSAVTVAGVETPVDVDSAKIVTAAEALMRKDGKDPKAITADEYAAYAMRVSNDPDLALSLA